jgi:hypothetical protein
MPLTLMPEAAAMAGLLPVALMEMPKSVRKNNEMISQNAVMTAPKIRQSHIS